MYKSNSLIPRLSPINGFSCILQATKAAQRAWERGCVVHEICHSLSRLYCLQQSAKVLTLNEKRRLEERTKLEKTARLDAANARKREMQELEAQRKKNEKPSDLEQVGG